eukprot:s492_g17.t1
MPLAAAGHLRTLRSFVGLLLTKPSCHFGTRSGSILLDGSLQHVCLHAKPCRHCGLLRIKQCQVNKKSGLPFMMLAFRQLFILLPLKVEMAWHVAEVKGDGGADGCPSFVSSVSLLTLPLRLRFI